MKRKKLNIIIGICFLVGSETCESVQSTNIFIYFLLRYGLCKRHICTYGKENQAHCRRLMKELFKEIAVTWH